MKEIYFVYLITAILALAITIMLLPTLIVNEQERRTKQKKLNA